MKYFFLLLFFLFNNLAFSQKYDNIWPIGLGYINPTSLNQEISYKIEFNQSVFQQDTIIRNMTVEETFASICDTAGNLQFYTNGIFINDYTHQLMENGDSLGNTDLMNNYNGVNRGLTISDGAIILPHPDSSHLYYLFHQVISSQIFQTNLAERLCYSLIDMQANNGRGRVRLKKQELLLASPTEKLDVGHLKAAKHANGKDWWLVQPLGDSVSFAIFLVKRDSVIRHPNQYFHQRKTNTGGGTYATFNPDATLYAVQNFTDSLLTIFNFNRCTGRFKHFTQIKDTVRMAQIVFSPNNRFLYINDGTYTLYQYDLEAKNIDLSKVEIGNIFPVICDSVFTSACTFLYCFANAPDGKIYALSQRNFLHTIERPNEKGVTCNFSPHSTLIERKSPIGSIAIISFPNFPHYRTPAIPESECWTNEEEAGFGYAQPTLNAHNAMLNEQDIQLYPNPAQDRLTMEQKAGFEVGTGLQIYNYLGQLLHSQTIDTASETVEIDVSGLPNGAYFIRVSSRQGVVSATLNDHIEHFIINK